MSTKQLEQTKYLNLFHTFNNFTAYYKTSSSKLYLVLSSFFTVNVAVTSCCCFRTDPKTGSQVSVRLTIFQNIGPYFPPMASFSTSITP